MTRRASLTRRVITQIRQRDPGRDGLRKATRAALVMPVAALAGYLLGGGTQAPAFTLVGSISLLIVADFPGTRGTRALAYCGLALNGAVMITLGTLVAPYPWLAVALCFAVGASVSLLGLLSEVIAAGQRATLMMFLLPVCAHPVGPVDERLLGWLIAVLICVPAALFLFPPRYGNDLRTHAAAVCTALADRIAGTPGTDGPDDPVTAAMTALRSEFLGSAFRPVALSAGSRALIRVVSNLQWLSDRVDSHTGPLLGHIGDMSVAVLRSSAEVLLSPDAARAAELNKIVATHRLIAYAHYDNDIRDILVQPDDGAAVELGTTLLNRRTVSATIGLTGALIAGATAADTRPVWARLIGRGLPETGVADRVQGKRTAVAALGGYLSTRSITVLNSLRTGLALALAFTVTLVFPVQNGLWVVLGALSVLRSSASNTRTSAMRAVTGTVIGFVIGAALIRVVGVDPVVLWTLLPVVAFGSTYVQVVGSFTASQAMFTMQVLIIFNMIDPTGWQIGLIRIEDIVLGAAVGLMVSVLLWPGGAAAAVQRAFGGALTAGSSYLNAAVLRVTRGSTPQTDAQVRELGREALIAARTHGDAVRIYLSENGGAIDAGLLDATNLIPRLRTTADLIADIPPPSPEVFPRARVILERHTATVCARLDGSAPESELDPIGSEFIPALRAEARGPDAAAAALPLVTAAANIGELEMSYPAAPAEPVPARSA